jgi:tetratricopeptide (TPR) repeat protein
MGILIRFLLIGTAALSAAELKGWEEVRDKLSRSLAADPSESNLSSLIPQLESLPSGPRLELAQRFAAARPDSDTQVAVLADAYGADGKREEVLATLEASLRARPGDQNLPALAARCMARWKFFEQAAALMTHGIETSSDPAQYLPWHALLIEYSRSLPNGGPAESLKRECERRVGAGARELKPWLLLAHALSLEGDLSGERRLYESALGLFPDERELYARLTRILEAADDLQGLVTLKRRQMESLPQVRASDYVELAHALLRAGSLEEGRKSLAEGMKNDRLSQEEKRKLAQRAASLDLLWDGIKANAEERAPCVYMDSGRTVSVDCGGKRLAYDFNTQSFRTSESSAEAARLAGVLLDRFDRARFAAAKSEKIVLTDEARSRLKAAGYISP